MNNMLPITGFENYKIDQNGKIYNKFDREITITPDGFGYQVRLALSGVLYTRRVNRLLYETFVEPIPSGWCVSYKDKNYYNLNINNLFIADKSRVTTRIFTSGDASLAVGAYKSGWHVLDIANELLHTKPDKVSNLLKLNDVPVSSKSCYRTNYKLNHNYFSNIDSPEKAYLLGLLYADGNVAFKTNNINLVSNDIELLEFFRSQIECNKEFYKNPYHEKATTFCFSSERMKKDLIRLGCVPNKSLILKFPTNDQVPEKFISHFLRGEFDGDGSIYLMNKNNENGRMMVYYCGSYHFCMGVMDKLRELEIKTCVLEKNINIFRVRITNRPGQLKLKEFLYKNSSFSLSRKRKMFERCVM